MDVIQVHFNPDYISLFTLSCALSILQLTCNASIVTLDITKIKSHA